MFKRLCKTFARSAVPVCVYVSCVVQFGLCVNVFEREARIQFSSYLSSYPNVDFRAVFLRYK